MIKYKKISILITIFCFIILSSNAFSESLIIPEKNQKLALKKKVISELKSEILPLKKPSLELLRRKTTQKNEEKEK